MISVEITCHIDIDSVSLLQPSVVRNTVAENLINRGTDTLREVKVVDGSGIGVLADDMVVNSSVDVLSCVSFNSSSHSSHKCV